MITKGNITSFGTSKKIADAIGIWVSSKERLIVYGFSELISKDKRQEIIRDPLVSFGKELTIVKSLMAFHGKTSTSTWQPIVVIQVHIKRLQKAQPPIDLEFEIAYFCTIENKMGGFVLNNLKTFDVTFPRDDSVGSVKIFTKGKNITKLSKEQFQWDIFIETEVIEVDSIEFEELVS